MTVAKKSGFTLIELIAIIVIIAIIASVSLPKFVNFKARAIENSEEHLMGALNTVLKLKYSENIAAGSAPENAWPFTNADGDPFSLLVNPPAYYLGGYPDDGVRWGVYWYSAGGYWTIWCPHYHGASPVKGNRYRYQITSDVPAGHQVGDFWRDVQYGH